jgi:hypothetical protein
MCRAERRVSVEFHPVSSPVAMCDANEVVRASNSISWALIMRLGPDSLEMCALEVAEQ